MAQRRRRCRKGLFELRCAIATADNRSENMSPIETLRNVSRELVAELARRDYDAMVGRCRKSRMTSADLSHVIRDYGCAVVEPPADTYDSLDAVKVERAPIPTWSVRVPVWTTEGRSDLTLELTIAIGPGRTEVELDDLHVL